MFWSYPVGLLIRIHKQVSVVLGFAVEGVATMLCRLPSKLLSDNEPQFANAIDSFVATALVVAAFDYSGGYYNPVLATGLKFVSDKFQS